jgi:hypothetical protein
MRVPQRSKTEKGQISRTKEDTYTSLYSCPGEQPPDQRDPSNNHLVGSRMNTLYVDWSRGLSCQVDLGCSNGYAELSGYSKMHRPTDWPDIDQACAENFADVG